MNGGINIYINRDLSKYNEKTLPIFDKTKLPRIFLQFANNWTSCKLQKLNYVDSPSNYVSIQSEIAVSTSNLNGTTTTYTGDVDLSLESGLYQFEFINTSGTYYSDVFRVSDLSVIPSQFNIIEIGTQTWSSENIAITEGLVLGTDYFYPDNDINNVAEFGLLYTYSAAEIIANSIDGYRIPTNAELVTLYTYLGGTGLAGGKMKETGDIYWNIPNIGATNSSKFNGRGAGYWFSSSFYLFKERMQIWTSDDTGGSTKQTYYLSYNSDNINGAGLDSGAAATLRLIKE